MYEGETHPALLLMAMNCPCMRCLPAGVRSESRLPEPHRLRAPPRTAGQTKCVVLVATPIAGRKVGKCEARSVDAAFVLVVVVRNEGALMRADGHGASAKTDERHRERQGITQCYALC